MENSSLTWDLSVTTAPRCYNNARLQSEIRANSSSHVYNRTRYENHGITALSQGLDRRTKFSRRASRLLQVPRVDLTKRDHFGNLSTLPPTPHWTTLPCFCVRFAENGGNWHSHRRQTPWKLTLSFRKGSCNGAAWELPGTNMGLACCSREHSVEVRLLNQLNTSNAINAASKRVPPRCLPSFFY
jgi:hypothetical protein